MSYLLESLFFPPGLTLVLILLALPLWRRRRGMALLLTLTAVLGTYLASTYAVSGWLMERLERPYPPLNLDSLPSAPAAQAIVILGAGRQWNAPDYGGDAVNRFGMDRLRYGARLQRRTGLPILVSGGLPQRAQGVPEGELMSRVLSEELRVPVRWVEGASLTTAENATYSKKILTHSHISRVYVVTHAWHMRRALLAFGHAGFDAIPAPTAYGQAEHPRQGLRAWLPEAGALETTRRFLHEVVGLAWYRLQWQ